MGKDLDKAAAELRQSEQAQAKERLAARRAELAEAPADADLAVLVGEAGAAYDRGAYWTAIGLLSDETLAYQRSLS